MSVMTTIVLEMIGDALTGGAGEEWVITARLGRDSTDRPLLAFRPQTYTFSDPDDWQIADFMIGNFSQFKRAGLVAPVSALVFKGALVDGNVDSIPVHLDYSMRVVAARAGLRFRCVLRGFPIYADEPVYPGGR